MSPTPYHSGVCYFPGKVNGRAFDYSPEAIKANIPVGTVRKFGNTGWDRRFYYVEGQRAQAFIDAGKRVIGVWTVPDNSMWATMANSEWKSMTEQLVRDVPIRSVIVGNEPGGNQADAYLDKLQIAADIFHNAGRKVQMAAPFPGTEQAVWEAASMRAAFEWVDGAAAHPYAPDPARSLAKVVKFREMLNRYGCPKPLHLDECGWSSGPDGVGAIVGEQKQAEYLTQMFANWKANASRLRLGNCLWYIWNDWQLSDDRWDHRGVIRPDGTRKPAYSALAAI